MRTRLLCGSTPLLLLAGAVGCIGEPVAPRVQPQIVEPLPSVGGEAYGVFARKGKHTVILPTPWVQLPSVGDTVEASLDGVSFDRLVITGTAVVATIGSIDSTASTARSVAQVEGVSLLNGRITFVRAVAVASSTTDGITATSSAEGSQILGLVIDGVSYGDLVPAANTTIALRKGQVILNEQVEGGDGVKASNLRVNLIHVISGSSEVIVASAASKVSPVLILDDPIVISP